MEEKKTINITLKIESSQVTIFESWLNEQLEVINFKILPNTDELYENDKTFQKLVKKLKDAQKIRDKYINEKNFSK